MLVVGTNKNGKRGHTRKNGDHISILRPIVALHNQLMCSCNKGQAVVVIKCFRDILPKGVTSTTGRDTPAASVVGITPEQITHGSLMRNFLDPIQRANVVQSIDGGTQTAVQAEDLVLDESGERKVVEEIGKVFPDIGIAVFAQALVIKPIHLCDLAGLMISSEDGDSLGVTDFEADKECDRLYRVVATVDIVTWGRKSVMSHGARKQK